MTQKRVGVGGRIATPWNSAGRIPASRCMMTCSTYAVPPPLPDRRWRDSHRLTGEPAIIGPIGEPEGPSDRAGGLTAPLRQPLDREYPRQRGNCLRRRHSEGRTATLQGTCRNPQVTGQTGDSERLEGQAEGTFEDRARARVGVPSKSLEQPARPVMVDTAKDSRVYRGKVVVDTGAQPGGEGHASRSQRPVPNRICEGVADERHSRPVRRYATVPGRERAVVAVEEEIHDRRRPGVFVRQACEFRPTRSEDDASDDAAHLSRMECNPHLAAKATAREKREKRWRVAGGSLGHPNSPAIAAARLDQTGADERALALSRRAM